MSPLPSAGGAVGAGGLLGCFFLRERRLWQSNRPPPRSPLSLVSREPLPIVSQRRNA